MIRVSQRGDLFRSRRAWIGPALVALFWPLNWLLPESARPAAYLFFPLWLGYVLTVDFLVYSRTGTSLLERSRGEFVLLFLASAPAWWLFEMINRRTQNWEYLGTKMFTGAEYLLLSTLSFSTVMPAVFETAEWVRSFRWTDRFAHGPAVRATTGMAAGMLSAGLAMLALTLIWPRYCYPLVWGAVFLILEPINISLGRRTFFEWLSVGDWRPVVSLSAGALVCGFFWEMWNYFSYPKWIYHTPGAQFWHLFEMPLLGYLGYLPFAWELYALRNFLLPQTAPLRL